MDMNSDIRPLCLLWRAMTCQRSGKATGGDRRVGSWSARMQVFFREGPDKNIVIFFMETKAARITGKRSSDHRAVCYHSTHNCSGPLKVVLGGYEHV